MILVIITISVSKAERSYCIQLESKSERVGSTKKETIVGNPLALFINHTRSVGLFLC